MKRLAERAPGKDGLTTHLKIDDYDPDKEHPEELTACGQFYKSIEEIVVSQTFDLSIGGVIMINAIVLGLETDLGEEHFIICEHAFALVFTIEMFLRMLHLGCEYFTKVSCLFDMLLVCTGDFDLWVAPLITMATASGGHHHHGPNMITKCLKLLRMFRVMRIVRLFKMFHQLTIILEAFCQALTTVMWVGLLIVILNYICAVFLTQTIGHNASMWGEKEEEVAGWFGTIGVSIRTLFIILTLAEWDYIALVIAEQINGFVVFALAIAYITLTAFTMVSLITGIISEELVGAQREDQASKADAVEEAKKKLSMQVKEVLTKCDEDGNGSLNPDEITHALKDEHLKLIEKLATLQIDLDEQGFKDMIDKIKSAHGPECDEVAIDDVADALKHLTGNATAASVWDVKVIAAGLVTMLTELTNKVNGMGVSAADVASVSEGKPRLESQMQTCYIRCVQIEEKVDKSFVRLDKVAQHLQTESALGQATETQAKVDRCQVSVSQCLVRLGELDAKLESQRAIDQSKIDQSTSESLRQAQIEDKLDRCLSRFNEIDQSMKTSKTLDAVVERTAHAFTQVMERIDRLERRNDSAASAEALQTGMSQLQQQLDAMSGQLSSGMSDLAKRDAKVSELRVTTSVAGSTIGFINPVPSSVASAQSTESAGQLASPLAPGSCTTEGSPQWRGEAADHYSRERKVAEDCMQPTKDSFVARPQSAVGDNSSSPAYNPPMGLWSNVAAQKSAVSSPTEERKATMTPTLPMAPSPPDSVAPAKLTRFSDNADDKGAGDIKQTIVDIKQTIAPIVPIKVGIDGGTGSFVGRSIPADDNSGSPSMIIEKDPYAGREADRLLQASAPLGTVGDGGFSNVRSRGDYQGFSDGQVESAIASGLRVSSNFENPAVVRDNGPPRPDSGSLTSGTGNLSRNTSREDSTDCEAALQRVINSVAADGQPTI